MTLRDLSEVLWKITEIHVWARRPEDNRLVHEFLFGENLKPSWSMLDDAIEGKLTIVERKINYHGDRTRGGGSEMGWGLNRKTIPDEILDAEMQHLTVSHIQGEDHISIGVIMQELTAGIVADALRDPEYLDELRRKRERRYVKEIHEA